LRWWACFVILIYALPGLAGEASISGKVSDSVGAVFENLPVVIKNVSTHKRVVTKTAKTGEFGPVPLPVGVYKVEIRAHCFKRYSRTITLLESESVRLDISLKETCSEPKIVE
jgi:hypothetical protein